MPVAKADHPETIQEQIFYSIKKIDLLHQSLDIPMDFNPADTSSLKFKFDVQMEAAEAASTVSIIVMYEFYNKEDNLLALRVENVFGINNVSTVMESGRVKLTDFSIFLIQLSIDHLRGIQSYIIKGTALANFYVPVFSNEEITNKVFA